MYLLLNVTSRFGMNASISFSFPLLLFLEGHSVARVDTDMHCKYCSSVFRAFGGSFTMSDADYGGLASVWDLAFVLLFSLK